MPENNRRRALNFTNNVLYAELIENAVMLPVAGRNLVFNTGEDAAIIEGTPRQRLPPMSSTTLIDALIVTAKALIVIRIEDIPSNAVTAQALGWPRFFETLSHPSQETIGLPLYRSPQDQVREVQISSEIANAVNSILEEGGGFTVRVNLWFAPAGTHCLIHNRHPFLETHVQVFGQGRMQKFREQDFRTLFEEIILSPGVTQPFFNCDNDGMEGFKYPWHQYYSDTDCIWMAVELHPSTSRERT